MQLGSQASALFGSGLIFFRSAANDFDTSMASKPIYTLGRDYQHSHRGKYWERGQKSKAGAFSKKSIYVAVGHALSNWEGVESVTAGLFGLFVDTKSFAAKRAYGSINGARAREAALRQAAEAFFFLRKDAYKKDRRVYNNWDHLEKCADILIINYVAASPRRNDIAHGVAAKLAFDKYTSRPWFLIAPSHQSRHYLSDKQPLHIEKSEDIVKLYKSNYQQSQYVFGPEEIKRFSAKFAFLFAEIIAFSQVIGLNEVKLSKTQLLDIARSMID